MNSDSPNPGRGLSWQAGHAVRQLPRERFLPVLRAAVAAAPARAEPRLRLARLLLQTDRLDELIALVGPALTDAATDPELLHLLGLAALATGDHVGALEALRRSVDKGFGQSLGCLAQVNRSLDRPDEALAAGLRALESCPEDHTAGSVVARTLLERGERERLWALCQGIRSTGSWGAYLPSAMALSATTDQQQREVERLIDRDAWFAMTTPQSTDHFNRRLADELLGAMNAPTLPRRKATVGAGRRIDQLYLVEGSSLLRDLFAMLRAGVGRYMEQRDALFRDLETAHPMVQRRPASVFLDSWAIAVQDDGHEEWHLHPSGWLSGVYYVDVPDLQVGHPPHAGEVEFGPFPFDALENVPSWPRWYLRPQTGQLTLFPSYYAHRTWPTGGASSRVCVAFDVVPASSPNGVDPAG